MQTAPDYELQPTTWILVLIVNLPKSAATQISLLDKVNSMVSRGAAAVLRPRNKSHFVIQVICPEEYQSLQTQRSLMCYWLITITML